MSRSAVYSMVALAAALMGGCHLLLSYESAPPPSADLAKDLSVADHSAIVEAPPALDAGPIELGPFKRPTLIAALDSPAYDDDPTLTADLRELYFNSTRNNNSDIWVSVRDSVTDPWPEPVLVAELNSGHSETTPEVAADGLTIWFASNRPGGQGDYDIWVSRRETRLSKWSPPTPVGELNSEYYDSAPCPTVSTAEIYFDSRRNGAFDIFHSIRDGGWLAWSPPVAVSEVNTSAAESDPFPTVDGRFLYFTRWSGSAAAQIYVAKREAINGVFATPSPVEELNLSPLSAKPWVSADQRYIVFSCDLYGTGFDDADICEASR